MSVLKPQIEGLTDISFDLDLFEADLAKGLYFDSNIPEGYGVGSSGALSAALFERYVPYDPLDISTLKLQLSQIESLFHGKSSGMDPLVSFLNCPILKHKDGQLELLMNEISFEDIQVELVDSGQNRRTAPLVADFMERLTEPDFEQAMQVLADLNDDALELLLSNDLQGFSETIRRISRLQYDELAFLIPDSIKTDWADKLKSNQGCYKLCGAGGGGYFLKIHTQFSESQLG